MHGGTASPAVKTHGVFSLDDHQPHPCAIQCADAELEEVKSSLTEAREAAVARSMERQREFQERKATREAEFKARLEKAQEAMDGAGNSAEAGGAEEAE